MPIGKELSEDKPIIEQEIPHDPILRGPVSIIADSLAEVIRQRKAQNAYEKRWSKRELIAALETCDCLYDFKEWLNAQD